MTDENNHWQIDKRISMATGINLLQLVAVIWFGASFYTQVVNDQKNNEARFATLAEQRKTQIDQMTKLQETQNQLLIQIASMVERINNQTDAIKEIRSLLTSKSRSARPQE